MALNDDKDNKFPENECENIDGEVEIDEEVVESGRIGRNLSTRVFWMS